MQTSISSRHGSFLILIGAFCFSTIGFVQAQAPEGATPYVLGALRMVGGGIALFLWCFWKGLLPERHPWPLKYVLPSVLGLIGFQMFFFKGVLAAGVAVGTVVAIGFSPIVVAVLGWLFLGERPKKLWYPATALALFGLVLLNVSGMEQANASAVFLPFAAGFSYACFFVFSKPLGNMHAPETVMTVLFLICGSCMLPIFWLYPSAWILTPKGVLVAVHLGVVATAFALTLTLAGLRTTPAATASTLSLAEPLAAAFLGFFLLNEPLTVFAVVGIFAIFLSVLILVLFSK